MPYIDLHATKVDTTLSNQSHLKWYAEHSFLPVGRQKGRMLVAFSDPLDIKGRELADRLFGKKLIPVIVTEKAIHKVLRIIERGGQQPHTSPSDDTTVVGIVNALIADAIEESASDIHIEPTYDRLRVRFRCDGIMIHHKDLPVELVRPVTSRLKILAKADITEKRRHQDGRILYEDPSSGLTINMRASFYVTIRGEKIVLRLLNKREELLDLNEIGISPNMYERFRYDALDVPSGVVIVTGPTGSGKTTTLYSCINYLNDINTSIITAEDPVEYVMEGIAQCSINPKINVTFEETLRHIVCQDPDVIVLGEIRDRCSAETAMQAALTGHKVLTTFHTEDSISGLLRLLNMDIEAFLISSTVVSVVAQRLLRKVCSDCAIPYTPTPLDLRRLGFDKIDELEGFNFKVGQGCNRCSFMGSRGRAGVFELLVLNEMVKDAILNRKTSYEIRRISLESSGLVTLLEDGLVKAARGEIAVEEVIRGLPRLHKPRPIRELQRLLGES